MTPPLPSPEALAAVPPAARPAAPAASGPPVLVLQPKKGWQPIELRELWRYRELLWFLALRDIQVRYKQTALGVAWAVLQPLFTMLIFTLVFGRFAGLDQRITGGVPYSVYTLCGLLPWQVFAYALTQSSNSVVNSRALITKVYFPRLLVPVAPLVCALIDFGFALLLLVPMMLWHGLTPGWPVLLLPLFLLLTLLTSLAVGLWLSSLNALYRDIQYTLPFLTQLWMFLTPIAYPASIIPERWQWVFGLNPLAGVVEGFRWALLPGQPPPGPMLAVSAVSVLVLLVSGLYFFRRMEKHFADVV
jgi:lipopolysaccharide transport system permease protein